MADLPTVDEVVDELPQWSRLVTVTGRGGRKRLSGRMDEEDFRRLIHNVLAVAHRKAMPNASSTEGGN